MRVVVTVIGAKGVGSGILDCCAWAGTGVMKEPMRMEWITRLLFERMPQANIANLLFPHVMNRVILLIDSKIFCSVFDDHFYFTPMSLFNNKIAELILRCIKLQCHATAG